MWQGDQRRREAVVLAGGLASRDGFPTHLRPAQRSRSPSAASTATPASPRRRRRRRPPRGLAFTLIVNPPVVHAGCPDLHRPRPAGHLPRLRSAIANDQTPTICVARAGVRLDVLLDFRLQDGHQLAPAALSRQLIQGRHGALGRLAVVFPRRGRATPALGWCILPPGLPTRVVSVVPVEGYATCLTPRSTTSGYASVPLGGRMEHT